MFSGKKVLALAGIVACTTAANGAPLLLTYGTGGNGAHDVWCTQLYNANWSLNPAYPVTQTDNVGYVEVSAPANAAAMIYAPRWYDVGITPVDVSDQTLLEITMQSGPNLVGWKGFRLDLNSTDGGQSSYWIGGTPATMTTRTFNVASPGWNNGKNADLTKLSYISLFTQDTGGTLDYRLQSINITSVPEPACLGLLSMTGLAMLRRRRSA